jgi:hypothetical protein
VDLAIVENRVLPPDIQPLWRTGISRGTLGYGAEEDGEESLADNGNMAHSVVRVEPCMLGTSFLYAMIRERERRGWVERVGRR